jgi:hypothetical protein
MHPARSWTESNTQTGSHAAPFRVRVFRPVAATMAWLSPEPFAAALTKSLRPEGPRYRWKARRLALAKSADAWAWAT